MTSRFLPRFFFMMLSLMLAALPARAQTQDSFAYVRLAPLVVGQPAARTTLTVTLVVPQERRKEAETLSTNFSDAFLNQLKGSGAAPGSTPDVWQIKVSLLGAAARVAAPGLIHDIQIDVTQGRS